MLTQEALNSCVVTSGNNGSYPLEWPSERDRLEGLQAFLRVAGFHLAVHLERPWGTKMGKGLLLWLIGIPRFPSSC